jgi:hypothetical protein
MKIPCPTCRESTRKGLLWLSGDDWLECPNRCVEGVLEVIEQRYEPVPRTISIPGVGTIAVPKHHPAFERFA